MMQIRRTLLPLTLFTACLFAAPPALAGPVGPHAPEPVRDGDSLAEYIEAPEVYIELYDLGAFERDVRQTSLGRLAAELLPFLEQSLEDAEVPEQASMMLNDTLLPVIAGELSCEDGIAATLADVLEFELGMASSDAVDIAAALGSRVSIAMEVDFTKTSDNESWAMAIALRPGGDAAIVNLLLPRLALEAGEELSQINVHMERDATGVYGAWDVDDGLLVVRPGLAAMVSDRAMANRLLQGGAATSGSGTGRRAVVTQFQMKRHDSIQRHERAWMFVSGDLGAVELEQSSDHERAVAQALGLDAMGDFEISLAADKGQLLSRVRLEKRGKGGLAGLVRGRAAEWNTLQLLTADALMVAGIPQSPSVMIGDFVALLRAAEAGAGGGEMALAAAVIAQNPILTALGDRGAFGAETLLFVRPGAAGIPMVYLAAEATPNLEQVLAGLEQYEVAGSVLTVKAKEIDGRAAWLISTPDLGKQWGLAVMRREGGVLASYSLLGLQAYARQRSREHEGDRLALIEGVRANLAASTQSGAASRVAGFAHVRVEPLAEWVWPMAMMAASMSGVEGLEDLPDAVELAEQIGDTTLILYDYDDRVELWGRGLLGGLGFLF